ncbi:hypothetical protein [Bradyrhizobium sp. 6(2017)]|uniref:hypothetical protein n=1 Tax=Bradyrhizobium sp. 6(2017) TaxID=1197460 RepID=UPI0013E16938|nr:hypothetical protein [Bradyrhizobium sp. 6(2017)]QIG92085.1 hypothetical protein G6P99_05925 [Bradyrhizobium sp. 6(2017)]
MMNSVWMRKARFAATAISLSCVVVLLAMAAPHSVSINALGSEWQCSKTGFVLTTCRQLPPA